MKFGVAVFLFSASLHAGAAQDVECWDGHCLQRGWTKTDMATGRFSDFQCYRDGCGTSGWIIGGSLGVSEYSQCKPGGCFKEGWWELDRQSQKLLRTVSCTGGNCLTKGWTTFTLNSQRVTECFKQDCTRQGWQSFGGGEPSVIAYCKDGGCFKQGWIENQY